MRKKRKKNAPAKAVANASEQPASASAVDPKNADLPVQEPGQEPVVAMADPTTIAPSDVQADMSQADMVQPEISHRDLTQAGIDRPAVSGQGLATHGSPEPESRQQTSPQPIRSGQRIKGLLSDLRRPSRKLRNMANRAQKNQEADEQLPSTADPARKLTVAYYVDPEKVRVLSLRFTSVRNFAWASVLCALAGMGWYLAHLVDMDLSPENVASHIVEQITDSTDGGSSRPDSSLPGSGAASTGSKQSQPRESSLATPQAAGTPQAELADQGKPAPKPESAPTPSIGGALEKAGLKSQPSLDVAKLDVAEQGGASETGEASAAAEPRKKVLPAAQPRSEKSSAQTANQPKGTIARTPDNSAGGGNAVRKASIGKKTIGKKTIRKKTPVEALAEGLPQALAQGIAQDTKPKPELLAATKSPAPNGWIEPETTRKTSAVDTPAAVDLHKISRNIKTGKTEVEVDVKNRTQGRIRGKVWAIGTFRFGDRVFEVPSHDGINTSQIDAKDNGTYGNDFSARRYSRKNLGFVVPHGAKFQRLSVVVNTRERGRVVQVFNQKSLQ